MFICRLGGSDTEPISTPWLHGVSVVFLFAGDLKRSVQGWDSTLIQPRAYRAAASVLVHCRHRYLQDLVLSTGFITAACLFVHRMLCSLSDWVWRADR